MPAASIIRAKNSLFVFDVSKRSLAYDFTEYTSINESSLNITRQRLELAVEENNVALFTKDDFEQTASKRRSNSSMLKPAIPKFPRAT